MHTEACSLSGHPRRPAALPWFTFGELDARHRQQSQDRATPENHSHDFKSKCCIREPHQEKHSSRWFPWKDPKDGITQRGEDRVRTVRYLSLEKFPVLRRQSHWVTAQAEIMLLKSLERDGHGDFATSGKLESCKVVSTDTDPHSPPASPWKPAGTGPRRSHPLGQGAEHRDGNHFWMKVSWLTTFSMILNYFLFQKPNPLQSARRKWP